MPFCRFILPRRRVQGRKTLRIGPQIGRKKYQPQQECKPPPKNARVMVDIAVDTRIISTAGIISTARII